MNLKTKLACSLALALAAALSSATGALAGDSARRPGGERRVADQGPTGGGDIVPIDQLLRPGAGRSALRRELERAPIAMEHGTEGGPGSPCHEEGIDGLDIFAEVLACIEYTMSDVVDTVESLPDTFSDIFDSLSNIVAYVESIPGMVSDLQVLLTDRIPEIIGFVEELPGLVADLPAFITNMANLTEALLTDGADQLPALAEQIPQMVELVPDMVSTVPRMLEAIECGASVGDDPMELIECMSTALLGDISSRMEMGSDAFNTAVEILSPAWEYAINEVPVPSALGDIPCLLDEAGIAADPDGPGPLEGGDVVIGSGPNSIYLGKRGSQAAVNKCEEVKFLPEYVWENLPDDFVTKPAKVALAVGGLGVLTRACDCLGYDAPAPDDLAVWVREDAGDGTFGDFDPATATGERFFIDDSELDTHDADMTARLDLHHATVTTQVARHDVDMTVRLNAHDVDMTTRLDAHDVDMTTRLNAHDAHVNADLEDHDAHINADLEDHDAHINADLEEHDAHINADLEDHDALMAEEHYEILQRLSGSNRLAIESNLVAGLALPSFVILGGPDRDPAGVVGQPCPSIAPVDQPAGQEGGLFELVRCLTRGGIDQLAELGYDTEDAEEHWEDGEVAWNPLPPASPSSPTSRDYRRAVVEYGKAIKSLTK